MRKQDNVTSYAKEAPRDDAKAVNDAKAVDDVKEHIKAPVVHAAQDGEEGAKDP